MAHFIPTTYRVDALVGSPRNAVAHTFAGGLLSGAAVLKVSSAFASIEAGQVVIVRESDAKIVGRYVNEYNSRKQVWQVRRIARG